MSRQVVLPLQCGRAGSQCDAIKYLRKFQEPCCVGCLAAKVDHDSVVLTSQALPNPEPIEWHPGNKTAVDAVAYCKKILKVHPPPLGIVHHRVDESDLKCAMTIVCTSR